MTKYVMAIDLHKCTGCSACAIACRSGNKVAEGIRWADYIIETIGKFPKVNFQYLPTLCNQCDNAACVAACPTEPKVMIKDNNGITKHRWERCLGCRKCEKSCPYHAISFNKDTKKVEKCQFCSQRLEEGEQPFCVEACPSQARVIGDITDPVSELSFLLKRHKHMHPKEVAGTAPNVCYVKAFNPKKL